MSLNSWAQKSQRLDLESLDDMQLLEEFAEELGAEDEEISATEVPAEEIDDGLSEEEKLMLGELDETEEAKIFEELGQEDAVDPKKQSAANDEIASGDNFDETIDIEGELDESESDEPGLDVIGGIEEDYDLLAPEDKPAGLAKETKPKKIFETLAEKKQREKNLVEELNSIKDKELDAKVLEITEQKKNRYTPSQVEALKVQLKDIIQSPAEYANIRKGTEIISLEDDKTYIVKKDITVKAYTLADAGNYRYIQNKKGKVSYKVRFNKISNIRRVTDLYQRPHYFSRIKKVKKVDPNDRKFGYSLRFNLHGGLTFTQYTTQIVGGSENYAPVLRTEFGALTKLNYPFQIGGSMTYESISGNLNRGGKFATKILSFGPMVALEKVYENYDLIFQPRISLFADTVEQASDQTKVHRLSDTSLLLGIEKHKDYKLFGKLTLGFNIQRKWIKPKAQNTGFDIGNDIRYDDSMALYVGHRSDWIW